MVPPRTAAQGSHGVLGGGNGSGHTLDALTAATSRYATRPDRPRSPRRVSGFLLAVVAAILVGAAIALAARLEYRCAATFEIHPAPSDAVRAHYRKELLHYAWREFAAADEEARTAPAWLVESPSEAQLRLSLTTTDRTAGLERVKTLAHGFTTVMAELAEKARATPTEGERLLEAYGDELDQSLDDAQRQLDAALAKLPSDDPNDRRQALRTQWSELRAAFSTAREQVNETSAQYRRLVSEGEPTHALVSVETRDAAFQADKSLQQDLAELTVALTEVKSLTLTVWQHATTPMQRLVDATGALGQAITAAAPETLPPATRAQLAPVQTALNDYLDRLNTFREAWAADFADLRETPTDAYTAAVLDRHRSIARALGDFLFASARALSQLRAAVNNLNEGRSDLARDHVLRSTLVREFHKVQNAHHRFEFAAGDVQSMEYFRLDSALKSARGLRRRTKARMDQIDLELQTEAIESARRQRVAETQAAKRLMEKVRDTADETIDSLVDLQEDLNLSADLSEEFQRAMLKVEVATSRFRLTQSYLDQTRSRLRDLQAKRLKPEHPSRIELQRCEVLGSAVDWTQRIRTGGVGAALTLLTVLLGQWWVSRR